MEIRFVSSNPKKIAEAVDILQPNGISVIASEFKVDELQTKDTLTLVHDKLLKAFQHVGRPLFVEHTGLYLEHLNDFPGGLTQIFWDTIQADRFAELFGRLAPNPNARARTFVSYCDGQRIFDFTGEISGIIVGEPRGDRGFQWDCVFQPEGSDQTFAEMGTVQKNGISMRRKALDQLAVYLATERSV